MNDKYLSKLSVTKLTAKHALSLNFREHNSSLQSLVTLFPRIVDETDYELIQKIDDQWRALPLEHNSFPESITTLEYSDDPPDLLW